MCLLLWVLSGTSILTNPATKNFHSETFVGDVRSDLTISATVNSYLPVALEPFNPMSDREDRVDAAIAQFLQAADEGRPIGVSEFLQQHAELVAIESQPTRRPSRLAKAVEDVL